MVCILGFPLGSFCGFSSSLELPSASAGPVGPLVPPPGLGDLAGHLRRLLRHRRPRRPPPASPAAPTGAARHSASPLGIGDPVGHLRRLLRHQQVPPDTSASPLGTGDPAGHLRRLLSPVGLRQGLSQAGRVCLLLCISVGSNTVHLRCWIRDPTLCIGPNTVHRRLRRCSRVPPALRRCSPSPAGLRRCSPSPAGPPPVLPEPRRPPPVLLEIRLHPPVSASAPGDSAGARCSP